MFGDLFRQVYRAPLVLLKSLLANPLSLFVYGLMSKWYIMVMLASIMVTFWVFKGLEKAGVLQIAEKVVSKALMECKSVAQNCTPLIMDLPSMWDCVQNPPAYEQSTEEMNLQKDVDEAIKHVPSDGRASETAPQSTTSDSSSPQNPYSQTQ